jgi:glycerol-3-phosphate O-acyltransferase
MNNKRIDQPAVASVLDRIGARRILQRIGVVHEPASGLLSDTAEVSELLADDTFDEALEQLAGKLDRDVSDVKSEAAGYLREMSATHSARVDKVWDGFGRWLNRAHDVEVDEEQARRVRVLSRKHSLLFLMSHRSYLDGFTLPLALAAHGIDAPFTMGGANLNFFPVGGIASRTGVVFIRRSTSDIPVYRLALRSYIGRLIDNRHNLCWSIEGGRTRTGKLRPPVYGILRYVLDALDASPGTDPLIIPVSFVYEQLHEVSLMTTEARGGHKRPEDLRWLVNFARSQGQRRLGRAYLDFGAPLPVRERLAELSSEDPSGTHAVERIALDTCHRINRVTPVTVTGVVCLALLAADRSLTLDEVLGTVAPLARYIEGRNWPVAGGVNLTDRATIRRTLQELVSSGVLSSYGAGTETIWGVGAQQHLVAAFYRNTTVHVLVDRAIGELSLVAAAETDGDAPQVSEQESLRLRDLLKFDFFFPARAEFTGEMRAELIGIDPTAVELFDTFSAADARRWLTALRPYTAHLVLRPFVDAYHVVADRLAEWDADEEFDEKRFLDECLRVGKQWVLQRRLASAESVSLELFKPVLRLARHRGLLESTRPELSKLRREFADEITSTARRINDIASLASSAAAQP